MKTLTTLLFIIITLTITPLHAEDSFSHTVLTLPDDPRNETPWALTITTDEQWNSFYGERLALVSFLESEAPIRPEIDFDQFQVLTGGLGVKPGQGYFLTVERVKERDDVIEVHIFDVSPDSSCDIFPAPSYPSATVVIKKVDKPFRFVVSPLAGECN